MKHRLFLDLDESRRDWFMYNRGWRPRLEMVEIEARRLRTLFPKLGKAIIIRSSDKGWHIVFPDAHLTNEEVEIMLPHTRAHKGHIFFSSLIGDRTLRVSKKPKTKIDKPYVVKVICG